MSFLLFATLAAGALQARGQQVAGEQQEIEFEQEAEEEKLSAEAEELERRQKLNKALAANAVSMATSGISGEGTPESISLENARQVSTSEGMIGLSNRLKQAQLKRQGSNAASIGKIQAASTLLKSGTNAASLMKG